MYLNDMQIHTFVIMFLNKNTDRGSTRFCLLNVKMHTLDDNISKVNANAYQITQVLKNFTLNSFG